MFSFVQEISFFSYILLEYNCHFDGELDNISSYSINEMFIYVVNILFFVFVLLGYSEYYQFISIGHRLHLKSRREISC